MDMKTKNSKNVKLDTNVKHGYVKDGLIVYKCFSCSRIYSTKFDKDLNKRTACTYKFSNHEINEFILLLRKGVDPNKDMYAIGNKLMNRHYLKSKLFIAD